MYNGELIHVFVSLRHTIYYDFWKNVNATSGMGEEFIIQSEQWKDQTNQSDYQTLTNIFHITLLEKERKLLFCRITAKKRCLFLYVI